MADAEATAAETIQARTESRVMAEPNSPTTAAPEAMTVIGRLPVHYAGLLARAIERLLNGDAPPRGFAGAAAHEHQQNALYGAHQLTVRQGGHDPVLYRIIVAPADAPISIGGEPADQHFAEPLVSRAPGNEP